MTKAEKISAVLSGDESGIIPYSFWSHFPGIDLDPHRLAEKTFEFFEQYDIDFIKTAPNGMFSVEDFGCICDYSEIDRGGVAKIVSYPIDTIDDWGKIKPIDCSRGALKRELLSVELLLQKVKDRAPVVITAFSPLTTAVKLSNKKIFQHMKESGSLQVHEALAAIAETTAEFIRKGIELGASGVFFAAQTGSYDIMDESLFREYGVPYDEMALRGCKKGWFNVIHIHGNNIMFDFFKNYPVNVLNWHINETAPTIPEARKKSDKCFMGGLNRMDITRGDRSKILQQIDYIFTRCPHNCQIITPGCVIRYPLNDDILRFIKDEIDSRNRERA